MSLSQTKGLTAMQAHMGKSFEGISTGRIDAGNETIEAMLSIEGEVVELFFPVNGVAGDKKGSVEKQLLEVMSMEGFEFPDLLSDLREDIDYGLFSVDATNELDALLRVEVNPFEELGIDI